MNPRNWLPSRKAETSHPRERSRAAARVKTAKGRKAQKNKSKPEKDSGKLETPYSLLAKPREEAIIAEMETWVNRPVSERLQEIETGKTPGKVKRPMNCFMLYRKAYQSLCPENNHQTISKMCGQSWDMETEEVKERFQAWARVERENHQLAHPEYKFSPSKAGTDKASKRKASDEVSEETSDIEEADHRRNTRQATDSSYTPASSAYTPYSREASSFPDFRVGSTIPNQSQDRSSRYEDIYPGQPYPAPYNEAELEHGQYYQQIIHRNPTHPAYEDVIIRRAAGPAGPVESQIQLSSSLNHLGLPSGQECDIMKQSGETGPVIDPLLIQQNPGELAMSQLADGIYYDGLQDDSRWYTTYGVDSGMYDPSAFYGDEATDPTHFQDFHLHDIHSREEHWGAESAEGARELQKFLSEP